MKGFAENGCKLICCLIISCFLLAGFTGCNVKRPVQPGDVTNEVESKTDIENFKPLVKSFIKYDFKFDLKGTKAEPVSFLAEGKYDLNQDGRPEDISILTLGNFGRDEGAQGYIKVNEVKQDIYMDYTHDGEVWLVDLDKNDKFTEVAIFDEGPSGDPHYIFYRFDGDKLYHIGDMDSNALINGEGKLISSFNTSRFNPGFYSAWFEINNNSFVQRTNDIKQYLGKSYKFDGGEAYFIPAREMPKEFLPTWESSREFKASEVKLIDVYFPSPEDRVLNYYFVEFPDGEKGMMYFWIGD